MNSRVVYKLLSPTIAALVGCSDNGVTAFNVPPEIVILSHGEGDTVYEGEVTTLSVSVSDPVSVSVPVSVIPVSTAVSVSMVPVSVPDILSAHAQRPSVSSQLILSPNLVCILFDSYINQGRILAR